MVWSAITEFTAFSVRSFTPDMTRSRRGRLRLARCLEPVASSRRERCRSRVSEKETKRSRTAAANEQKKMFLEKAMKIRVHRPAFRQTYFS
jgi:hypothetical protein